jgi:hypothetical protein
MQIYNWYHSNITDMHYVHEYRLQYTWHNPLASLLPFSPFPFAPHSSPLLTWNPPCCDRIRPPRSQVARKLIFPFPPLVHIPPIPKSRPPGVSQIQIYIHQDDIANLAHKIEHSYTADAVKSSQGLSEVVVEHAVVGKLPLKSS